jgi:hypothetical protein
MAFLTLLSDFEGTKIKEPKEVFKAGQVVEVRGVFDDDSDAGAALAIVVKPHSHKRGFYMIFVEAASDEWGWHLLDRGEAKKVTLVKVIKKWDETEDKTDKGEEVEWITAWRVLAEKDDEANLDEVPWVKHKGKAAKSIDFVRSWIVSDKAPTKVKIPLSQ